jgi:hypothetical protein
MKVAFPLRQMKEYALVLRREKLAPDSKQTLFQVFLRHINTNRENIDDHFENNTGIFAFWCSRYELEKYRFAKLERNYQREYANIYLKTKMRYPARTSETEIKAAVSKNQELLKMEDRLDLARYRLEVFDSIVKIMKVRHETLINFGATLRKEMDMQTDTMSKSKVRM